MFSHVMVGANDMAASERFYDALFEVFGTGSKVTSYERPVWTVNGNTFVITPPIDGKPATPANGGTIGFTVSSPEQGEAWHAAGLANGGEAIEDAPGWRGNTEMRAWLAYLRDPAGNKLCAMHRG